MERPLENASRLAAEFSREQSPRQRRALAQFFTPHDVARYMATLASTAGSPQRLLDPGAGTGVLACALAERLTESAHLDAYEVDPEVADLCELALTHAAKWLETERGVTLTFEVHRADFVLENAKYLNPDLHTSESELHYDAAILNPPYFKLQKNDPRAAAAHSLVHGQPNIYALFMGIAACLLESDGVMVSITPRSFAAGDYFRRFRQHLFAMVLPERVHLFASRKDAFRGDAVLQENVIIRFRRSPPDEKSTVVISESRGLADLDTCERRAVPLVDVVDAASADATMRIPTSGTDDSVVEYLRGWPCNLKRLGLMVSTGPVVAFRAQEYLRFEPNDTTVPLLWLNHVKPLAAEWPTRPNGKAQYVAALPGSQRLLIRNDRNYVLLRRFTAKEERRRLTAAPLYRGQLPGDLLGLENHLNYVHRPQGDLTRDEALGLSALFSSALLDRYLRISNGNTQVNASELRSLPLPDSETLARVGQIVRQGQVTPERLDAALADILDLPQILAEALRD